MNAATPNFDDRYILHTPRDQQDFAGTIRTASGRYVRPFFLREEDVFLPDIAHALARITRFTGHGPFYSVAQHSVGVSQLMRPLGKEARLAGLLHDAAEYVLNDLASPVKKERINALVLLCEQLPPYIFERIIPLIPEELEIPALAGYKLAGDHVDGVIFRVFGLDPQLHATIKPHDDAMFMREAASFWGTGGDAPHPRDLVRPVPPPEAERMFLREFADIVGTAEAVKHGVLTRMML